jgi:hypothetical protein
MNVSGNGNPSPTVREDLEAIRAQLDTYAKPRGGTVKVMANMRHLWEEIYNNGVASETPRILIAWRGETARGEYAGGQRTKLHRVDRKWTIVIMRGHGFKNMVTESAGQPGTPEYYEDFADSVETVRDGCRVMSNLSCEDIIDYKGCSPLPNVGPTNNANIFLDAYAVEFESAADIPEILPNGTTG